MLPDNKKLVLAKTLENVNSYLSEAFDPATATQRSDMGDYKKFCLALTNLAIPNQIAMDLVHTAPMSSFVGNIAYVKFIAGEEKGGVSAGDNFNDPWALGEMTDSRREYTSRQIVTERIEMTTGSAGVEFMWQPVNIETNDAGLHTNIIVKDTAGNVLVEGTHYWIDATDTQHVKLTNGGVAYIYNVGYMYDNVVIPQAKLPTLVGKMDNISLQARARRIAVRYSQIAAFQAKTDYGMDMAGELARQAVAELNYEVDTEICDMLVEAAGDPESELTWSKTLPVGVSKMEHYAGFGEIIERAKVMVYDKTKKHMPNTMLMAANCLPVLQMVPGFKAASVNDISG